MTALKKIKKLVLQNTSCLAASSFGRTLAVTAFLVISLSPELALTETLHQANGQEFHLYGHMKMLTDPNGTLGLSDIIGPKQTNFIPQKGYLNRSYTDDTVWVRLLVTRDDTFPSDAYLRLWPPYLDHVEIFVQQEKNSSDPASYNAYRMGDHYPAANRPVRHMEFVIPFQIPGHLSLRSVLSRW